MTVIHHVELLWAPSYKRKYKSGVCFYFKDIINCLILHSVTCGKEYVRIVSL